MFYCFFVGCTLNGSSIKIESMSKSFGNFEALKNVSFEIKKGEFFSILGPSGCGKTTLLRIIGGFEEPNSGKLFIDDIDVIKLPPNKRHVNTIFQNYALFPHLSVYDNVAFSLRLKKADKKIIDEEVFKYLELVKLKDHSSKYPSQLSGGQKQRVSIARALINKPNILLLYEPLSALDAKLRQHMLVELDAIHDQIGITFIYVTHDQTEALSVSDRIAIMKDGELLQLGTPSQIYESPANSFVADFIGDTNFIQGNIISTYKNQTGDDFLTIETNIGQIKLFKDKEVSVNNNIKITIRPEKIRITKEKPQNTESINILEGFVYELVYTGFQSKFYVSVNNNMFKVFKQHINYFMDDNNPIKWKDSVYIWWNPNDSYIVEVK